MTRKYLYARVSHEKLDQDVKLQINSLMEAYGLDREEIKLYVEEGSAYKQEKFHKRTEFLSMLNDIFDNDNISVKDIFLGNLRKSDEEIIIYVYSTDRLSRIFEHNLLFQILCDLYNVYIYTFNKREVVRKDGEDVMEKFARYIHLSMGAYSSEKYSSDISKHTIKATRLDEDEGITKSYKGNVWGKPIYDKDRNELNIDKRIELKAYCIKRITQYEENKIKRYYNALLDDISRNLNVGLSKAYLTGIKKELIQTGVI